MPIQLNSIFPSSVAIVQAQNFLEIAKRVSNIEFQKVLQKYQVHPVYPVIQTENMVFAHELREFNEFVLHSADEMLDAQGYNVRKVRLSINDLWCQKHMKSSGHERHVHNNGAVLSAFYMLECPSNSSSMLFYDPRAGKEYGFVLPEKDERNLTEASNVVNYTPSEGELIFANSYIPHGFTRNLSESPFTFIHINIYASWLDQKVDTKLNTFTNQAIVV